MNQTFGMNVAESFCHVEQETTEFQWIQRFLKEETEILRLGDNVLLK